MTLTADKKGRLTCRDLFTPEASFAAERDDRGRIILVRLARQESPPKVVKPVAYKGGWIMPGEVDAEKLAQDVAEERQRRDENLLG
jgi:hypothetical protein